MNGKNHNGNSNTYLRSGIKGYCLLEELALNLSWTWNHNSDELWNKLNPSLWELTHNPWVVLQTVSKEKLIETLSDPDFYQSLEKLSEINRTDNTTPGWFQLNHSKKPLTAVAYFSMEFMLSEALPIYSGGLGNVAGDQLKAASALGVPVVGVGLLYQQGYFRQTIAADGSQHALFPYNDPGQLPITPLRKENGEWLRLEIPLPGYSLWVRAWQVQVGRVRLLLLDSNDAANRPVHRGITSELYGGDSELRLNQELLLGISGWRLLEAIGIHPEVCHLNEGHAGFAVLERARSFMKATGLPFQAALAATRAGNIFTTHTAVPAGFDRFSPALIEQYLSKYAQKELGISVHDLLALGRLHPHDHDADFNMAYLALHGSGASNGVSRLHGDVSRDLFAPLFPHWPVNEVPIGHVTNGVHMPSWDSLKSDNLWTDACGKSRWLGTTEKMEADVKKIPDERIWKMRNNCRQTLVEYARRTLHRQLESRGTPAELVESVKNVFDPYTLTLGFARRFATYKRPNMLLHDPERLLRILNNTQFPVQLIIAGKAHPADKPGIALIKDWIQFIRRPDARSHVIFISDYDIHVAQQLVQGVDVWINTPRRPWEACGTSGMKVLVNGGLNLSVLDGWWAEAYTPEVGWAFGDAQEHGDLATWDANDASVLYDILENQVIPEFYRRDENGIPKEWISRIRNSMSKLTPQYSANRAVREYTENYYIPAAIKYQERSAEQGKKGRQIVEWKDRLNEKWKALRFSNVKVETIGNQYQFEVRIYLDGLGSDEVKVELYADATVSAPSVCQEMIYMSRLPHDETVYVYRGSVPDIHPVTEYTPRIVPVLSGVSVPLENNLITWQH